MTAKLSQYFSLNRRFSRSINLERDLEQAEAVQGYIPTEKASDSLRRILGSILHGDSTQAWTITGVYGTGKSAFAHFLASLCAPEQTAVRQEATKIAHESFKLEHGNWQELIDRVPERGYVRAVVTAQQEPLSHTIVRALNEGISSFWKAGRDRNRVASETLELLDAVDRGKKISSRKLLSVARKIARTAGTHMLLIVDELGKTLEYAAQHQDSDELYLLQQLAELPKEAGAQIYFVGLLHQAFADYARRLTSAERNEWAKIQGRFAPIRFQESSGQMFQLMGRALIQSVPPDLKKQISRYAAQWHKRLSNQSGTEGITEQLLSDVYPLHPISTLVLPEFCIDYAQNDRSLFTFLTSSEPYSFQSFLNEVAINDQLPTLKLDRLYDYFVEAIGLGMAAMPNVQRWLEIQERIADARHLDSDTQRDLDDQRMLKAIGLLNLVTTGGVLRATRSRAILAMCDSAVDEDEQKHWEAVIERLIEKRIIVEYKELDEIRIWQGSEFDIEGELANYIASEQMSLLSTLLEEAYPLNPLVAQRHSYETGTLRYFERHYLHNFDDLDKLQCSRSDSDGFLGYWVGEKPLKNAPEKTTEGKPLVILSSTEIDVLRTRAVEFSALKKMLKGVSRLQLDKVARREVEYRLVHAEKLLGETLGRLFNPVNPQTTCWVRGQRRNLSHATALNGVLSELCDGVYDQGLVLRNELINRRKLTSQGATAQGKLLKAMIAAPEQEHLGLTGNGPEVTMYASVLRRTEIHRQESNGWSFYPPTDKSVLRVWKLIDDFCLEAKTKPQSLGLLYQQLEAPPYGVKRGVIPVLLAAVLLYRADDVSVYKNGTFIPTLGSEHFELLVKDPSRFSVKYVQMNGLRVQVFRQLEELIVGKSSEKSSQERNATLLSVVKPLVKFANSIHPFTKQTRLTTPETQAVLKALLRGQEPDHLLFHDLPVACGMKPLEADAENDVSVAQSLCDKLVTALRELRAAYDTHVLERGRQLLCDAFSSEPEHLQEDLRSRSRRFVNNCIDNQLRQFLKAAVEEHKPDRQWLESLLFIVVNKPLTHWVDADITAFELNLNQLVKQLISLETLQGQVNHQGSGFRAFKFTLTANNGNEKDDIAIIEQGDMETALEKFAQEILEDSRLSGDPKRQKALLAIMARQLLNMDVQTINELEAQRSKKQAAQSRSPKGRRSSN